MKSLADLKRRIAPGVRLLCIENTYRPVLNGGERFVTRVQTNGFYWNVAPVAHDLIIHSVREVNATCSCGAWSITAGWFNASTLARATDHEVLAEIKVNHEGHKKNVARDSWTEFEKAKAYTFDGTDVFTFGIREGHHVRLQILASR